MPGRLLFRPVPAVRYPGHRAALGAIDDDPAQVGAVTALARRAAARLVGDQDEAALEAVTSRAVRRRDLGDLIRRPTGRYRTHVPMLAIPLAVDEGARGHGRVVAAGRDTHRRSELRCMAPPDGSRSGSAADSETRGFSGLNHTVRVAAATGEAGPWLSASEPGKSYPARREAYHGLLGRVRLSTATSTTSDRQRLCWRCRRSSAPPSRPRTAAMTSAMYMWVCTLGPTNRTVTFWVFSTMNTTAAAISSRPNICPNVIPRFGFESPRPGWSICDMREEYPASDAAKLTRAGEPR